MNSQSRKFQLTINNPKEHDITHEVIYLRLQTLKGLVYCCLSDEIGLKEKTPHTHVYIVFQNPKLFSTVKNLFPEAHIENARGTSVQNRDYVFKQGKWQGSSKEDTSIPGTQKEYGAMPCERNSPKPELALLYELIKEGYSNADILAEYPEYMLDITHIERTRLVLKQEEYRNVWRDVETTYIYGVTGSGKSRYVMEKYGYENVFRVTDYRNSFDTYRIEEVIIFEEFNSSLKIQDMLNYLDGYPLKLPCRYSDKIACFTKVYILSNIELDKQYPNVKTESIQVYEAFLRRIHKIIWFKSKDERVIYNSVKEYQNRDAGWVKPPEGIDWNEL